MLVGFFRIYTSEGNDENQAWYVYFILAFFIQTTGFMIYAMFYFESTIKLTEENIRLCLELQQNTYSILDSLNIGVLQLTKQEDLPDKF